jgi:hypothetical protein
MNPGYRMAAILAATCFAATGLAQGFKFSQEDEAAVANEQERQQAIDAWLSTPCRDQIKNRKIMLMIGERHSGGRVTANQQNYRPHFEAINRRLRGLGLRTTTPEEVRKQVAQAEIDAYFKGDPDAALAASRKFGAGFVLRGLIEDRATFNRIIQVNEVTVSMSFTLVDAGGRMISDASAQGGSYAGSDTRSMAATLINEQADEVVAKLYGEYCAIAGLGEARRRKQ